MRSIYASALLATFVPLALGRSNTHPNYHNQPKPTVATPGTYVADISQCPAVKPRTAPPKNIHDLRPDDFSVAMAIGDSITAGAFAKGIDTNDKYSNWVEWRGLSYAGGGEEGAVTMPNILKHYNGTLVGGARGYNPGYEICFGSGCPVGPVGWNNTVDQLNAGQSGAYASNLLHEAEDYLALQVKSLNISESRFKYLSFQVGANDVCQLCAAADAPMGPSTKGDFENNVRAALEHVRMNIPNTLVNLLGAWKLTDIYACIAGPGAIGNFTRNQMDRLVEQYNTVLQNIVADYKRKNYDNFAVIWQPPNLPFKEYPIEGMSFLPHLFTRCTDSLHLSRLWNRLTLNQTMRAAPFTWEKTTKYRCLEENDRIQT
ncbi:hypothetical protein FRC12_018068 [Ceratobasidium sp. 428]|nr:hypothetical protein FRC12_018068 [Ceratobasidium sp. 428]